MVPTHITRRPGPDEGASWGAQRDATDEGGESLCGLRCSDTLFRGGCHGPRLGGPAAFVGIENPVGGQFRPVVDEEPRQRVDPYHPGVSPAEGFHEDPVHGNQCGDRPVSYTHLTL